MRRERTDVLVVGSGAGGGTVARRLIPLVERGMRVLVLEQGARLAPEEFTGDELDMPPALYEDAGGFLTADGAMTLAFGRAYGGSTAVYTGTSLQPPRRVIEGWDVPGLEHGDLVARTERYMAENHVHLLPDDEINENNRLFLEGCRRLGWEARRFPVNVKGCRGSSLCNLGCPNRAKQGTDRVQLPAAEAGGVEVVTRAQVVRLRATGDGAAPATAVVRVHRKEGNGKGEASSWEPGDYEVRAGT
ncbi:MAG: NAD(P)-dependent oxidoreductase, partial [Gemmatimonadota bacterium]